MKSLLKALNELLAPSLFTDYCPNGIQIEGRGRCNKVATAVSADLATIEKAIEKGVDTLIVHHGLFWNRDPYPITGILKRRVELLLSHGISLLAYHLPLDAHVEVGNNWRAAREMGWSELGSFKDFGVIGSIEAQPVYAFKEKIESFYGKIGTFALGGPERIKRVALISGGAYKEIAEAAQAGADCFISGNFDEPAWSLAHEWGIHYFAMGHTATEKVGPKALCEWIQENLQKEVFFIDTDNPF